MKPFSILSFALVTVWSIAGAQAHRVHTHAHANDSVEAPIERLNHKEVLIKVKVDNVQVSDLMPEEILFMDQVWKDAYMSVSADNDISFEYVDLETEESTSDTHDRGLWWGGKVYSRYSYSSVYGFRFNYWCDLCWDDPCHWGYGRARTLRGGQKKTSEAKNSSPNNSKKSGKKSKKKSTPKESRDLVGMDVELFEQVFCRMLAQGPFEAFRDVQNCVVVYGDR